MIQKTISRLWFLSKGCKQVPLDLTGGKVLWVHPDGYFLNAYGQQIKHNFTPTMLTGDYTHGGAYPMMRQFGHKNCHVLVCVTFHGPRPVGFECDHINGDKLDYRPCNLEWVTPAENRRRAKYLRTMRKCGFDPRIFTADHLHEFFAMPFEEFERVMYHHKNDE